MCDVGSCSIYFVCDLSDDCDSGVDLTGNCIGSSGRIRSFFYRQCDLCNPIHVWRTGQLSVACGSDVRVVGNHYGAWRNLEKIIRCVCILYGKPYGWNALCGDRDLPVLRSNFRFRSGDGGSSGKYDDPDSRRFGI